jgi:hypothetical protein
MVVSGAFFMVLTCSGVVHLMITCPAVAYRIAYPPDSVEHLEHLSARDQTTVLDSVDAQLMYQPTVETRNRKPCSPILWRPGNYA